MKHWPVEAVENRALCGFPQLPQALLVFIESCITLLDTSPFFFCVERFAELVGPMPAMLAKGFERVRASVWPRNSQ
jgi:hypothetical protein